MQEGAAIQPTRARTLWLLGGKVPRVLKVFLWFLGAGLAATLLYRYFSSRRRPANVRNSSIQPRDGVTPAKSASVKRTTTTQPSLRRTGVRFPFSELRGRKVSCSTNGIFILHNQMESDIVPSGVPLLLELAAKSDLYLITQCDSDEVERRVLDVLHRVGLFEEGLNPHKVLFCSTTLGKAHIARQLETYLHIDADNSVIETLAPHIPCLVLIDGKVDAVSLNNDIYIAPSVSELFTE